MSEVCSGEQTLAQLRTGFRHILFRKLRSGGGVGWLGEGGGGGYRVVPAPKQKWKRPSLAALAVPDTDLPARGVGGGCVDTQTLRAAPARVPHSPRNLPADFDNLCSCSEIEAVGTSRKHKLSAHLGNRSCRHISETEAVGTSSKALAYQLTSKVVSCSGLDRSVSSEILP